MKKETKQKIISIIITIAVFWLLDSILHYIGVGETKYYYLSKLGNSIIFAVLWFFVFNSKKHYHKIIYSLIFATWVSFYYLVSSYSGAVQWLGIYARYTPPPFVLGTLYLSPYLWWIYHALGFYLGLIISDLIKKNGD